MTYAVEEIANTLQNARKAKGLTQRALGRSAAVPQSHVSKIERGAVDLRVSSLVELARVLDLELMLVPRRNVPVVDSIIGSHAEVASAGKESEGRPLQELMRLQDAVGELLKANSSDMGLAQLAGLVRQLQFYRIPARHLGTIRSVRQAVQASRDDPEGRHAVRDWLSQLGGLRDILAHDPNTAKEAEGSRPAYSLDEDRNG